MNWILIGGTLFGFAVIIFMVHVGMRIHRLELKIFGKHEGDL